MPLRAAIRYARQRCFCLSPADAYRHTPPTAAFSVLSYFSSVSTPDSATPCRFAALRSFRPIRPHVMSFRRYADLPSASIARRAAAPACRHQSRHADTNQAAVCRDSASSSAEACAASAPPRETTISGAIGFRRHDRARRHARRQQQRRGRGEVKAQNAEAVSARHQTRRTRGALLLRSPPTLANEAAIKMTRYALRASIDAATPRRASCRR